MRELWFVKALGRLEHATVLDPAVAKVRTLVNTVIQPQAVRDVLHGVPFGHPVHPIAAQIPIGAWTSAAILDALPGGDRAARTLVGLGVLSAAPAVASGYTDWSDLHEQQMRVGIIHSAANATAVTLYALSYVQRVRGRQTSGKVLAYLGFAVVSGAGFLGGHLAYRQAAGANHAEEIPHRFPKGWHPIGRMDELPEGELSRAAVGGITLVVLRHGSSVRVLSDVCSHLSGPLHRGKLLDGDGDDPCVQCPWHGSVFSMGTGEVVRGPATAPQPRFDTRVIDGTVEVRLQGAG